MRRAVGVFGELLLTAGVIVLLFAAYVTWGTGAVTAAAQDELRDEIITDWSQPEKEAKRSRPEPPPEIGDGIAVMTIPRFGESWQWVVVEGVYLENLREGPGHYPDTAMPGEKGNFAVAGHRTTYGAPFHQIDLLEPGDRVFVDTKESRYVYRITQEPAVIVPSETWVVDPVPGASGTPTDRLLTMTSCHPKWSASHRMYATGELVRTVERDSISLRAAAKEGL